jgi:hypothetical protein
MIDVRSVDERLSTARVDLRNAHEQMNIGMRALGHRLRAAFNVTQDPASIPAYGQGPMRGELSVYTGEPLDWVVDSWIGSPERGFSNHHLTIWLSPQVRVPHLGFAIGTIPELFVFADLVPRSDLWTNPEELDRYHAAFNELFLEVTADPRFAPFVSKEPYIRQAISPIGLCKTAAVTEENVQHVLAIFRKMLDRWIVWVKEAHPVPEAERAALGARDAFVRRTICERDPANIVAEKVLGPEMTRTLVNVLKKGSER